MCCCWWGNYDFTALLPSAALCFVRLSLSAVVSVLLSLCCVCACAVCVCAVCV